MWGRFFSATQQRQSSDPRAAEEEKIKCTYSGIEGLNFPLCEGTLSCDIVVFNFSFTDINELFVVQLLINDLPDCWSG